MMNKILYFISHLSSLLLSTLFWKVISLLVLTIYLAPMIFHPAQLNVLVYDNLDSNIVWFKILAQSGMIFSENDTIVPNMMNGLPRLSYGSEFNAMLWLYYFFSPIYAYSVNTVLIHLVAFISMFVLIRDYIIKEHTTYRYAIIYCTALIYALQPFWPSLGLSIAALPLVTYTLANIYYNKSTYKDWVLLVLLPFYSSFVLVYLFYLVFAFIFLVINSFIKKSIHTKFLLALCVMGTVYILIEYRLFTALLLDDGFISHRIEFNVFFTQTLGKTLKDFTQFFLHGHTTHLHSLYMPFLLPIVLLSLFSQVLKPYNKKASLFIFIIFIASLYLDIWTDLLTNVYTPFALIFSITFLILFKNQLSLLDSGLLIVILLSALYSFSFYDGFRPIIEVFPIFKSFSLARASFLQPLVWGIVIAMSLKVLFEKYNFSIFLILILILLQIQHSFKNSFFTQNQHKGYLSFENYFAPDLFEKIKDAIPEKLQDIRVVSFGIEPAVSLYNGFYTIDGYSTNYPLAYKKTFRDVLQLNDNDSYAMYDNWGSKAYILSVGSSIQNYQKGITIEKEAFNIKALCKLKTDYMISTYKIKDPIKKNLIQKQTFEESTYNWDIYLYKIYCPDSL